MKLKEQHLLQTNVFQATEDSYISGAVVDDFVLYSSSHHRLNKRNTVKSVILDPLAPDYKEAIINRGDVSAPDEILEAIKPLALKIPLKSRDELDRDELPSSDLLRAIHYYSNRAKLVNISLDETALLALGMAAELWADELIGETDPLIFLIDDNNYNLSKEYPPDSLDSEDEMLLELPLDGYNHSESDIMSIELLESDTDDEIKETARKRQRISNSKKKRTDLSDDPSSSDSPSRSSSGSGSGSDSDPDSLSSSLSSRSGSDSSSSEESDGKSGESANSKNKLASEETTELPERRNESSVSQKVAHSGESNGLIRSDTTQTAAPYLAHSAENPPNLDFYDSEIENGVSDNE